jgi:transposase InsO family protein
VQRSDDRECQASERVGQICRRNKRASDGGMDRQPTDGGLWVGATPRYLIRDRDACYGDIFVRRVRSLGIRDHPTAARSPWQNGYAERLIGVIGSYLLRGYSWTGGGVLAD